jgi:hypothetical protein
LKSFFKGINQALPIDFTPQLHHHLWVSNILFNDILNDIIGFFFLIIGVVSLRWSKKATSNDPFESWGFDGFTSRASIRPSPPVLLRVFPLQYGSGFSPRD